MTFAGETVFEGGGGGLGEGVVAQDREFFASIREGRPPSCAAEDGVRALEPLQAAYDQMLQLEDEGKYRRRWAQ